MTNLYNTLALNFGILETWNYHVDGLLVLKLLLVFQLKHFLCDFPLQGEYMLGKFKPGWDFIGPLSAHTSVHALATLSIALFFGCSGILAVILAIFDFCAHFLMDRIKAGPKYLGRFKPLTAQGQVQAGALGTSANHCKLILVWV